MTTETYEIFATVAEEKSLTRTAEILHLTPSAVSYAITRLEDKLGIRLFIRSNKSVELTETGAQLLVHVNEILNAERRLQDEVSFLGGEIGGKVSLGVLNSICCNWAVPIIEAFSKEYPNITISINQGDYSKVDEWLTKRTMDLCFFSRNQIADEDSIPIMKDRIMCVAPKDFVPINKNYVTYEDIMENSFIALDGVNDFERKSFMKKHGLNKKSNYNVSIDSSMYPLVKAGLGLGIVFELGLRGISHDGFRIYPIEPAHNRIIALKLIDKSHSTPAARLLYKFIPEFMSAHPELTKLDY